MWRRRVDYESVSRTMYKEEKKRNECERLFCEAEFCMFLQADF